MSAAPLLNRLDGVKQTAPGRWLARCPAHKDRSPSLSIRELDDGRVLLHDFGGCEVGDVLETIGLTLSDLFEKPLGNLASSHSQIPSRDLLEIINHEIIVAAIILADVRLSRAISDEQWMRIAQAAARIGGARDHARG